MAVALFLIGAHRSAELSAEFHEFFIGSENHSSSGSGAANGEMDAAGFWCSGLTQTSSIAPLLSAVLL